MFYNSDVEVNLGSNRKFSNIGIEDIKRSNLSGNLWSFPYLFDVIARLVVVKLGFTCFFNKQVFKKNLNLCNLCNCRNQENCKISCLRSNQIHNSISSKTDF